MTGLTRKIAQNQRERGGHGLLETFAYTDMLIGANFISVF
jgi:hypothetical protein